MLYHAGEYWLPGGFLGVDVFFVISGFLITRNLVTQIGAGTFSYTNFYRHRVRRLFPALFAMLVCVSPAAYLILSPVYQAEFGRTLIATALFVSNFAFERLSSYFDEAAALKPLLHTWSLAVEEQFYLLFPPFLVFVRRRANGHFLPAFLVCGAISFILYLWLYDIRSSNAAFFFTPARAFELMVGAALAVKPLPSGSTRQMLAAAGLGMIMACALVPRLSFLDVGTLLACLGAAAIIGAGERGSSYVAALLGLRPFQFIGDRSYALYLWHWPILSLAKNYLLRDLTVPETFAAIAAALLLADLSWRFVEQPALKRTLKGKRGFAAVIASGVAVVLGAALVLGNGFPQRFSPEAQRLFAYRDDFSPWRTRCHDDDAHRVSYEQSCTFGAPRPAPTIAVWADSFGAELAPALGQLMPWHTILQLTYSGCPPALNFNLPGQAGCTTHNSEMLAGLLQDRRVDTIVLFARYSSYPDIWDGFARSVAALSAAGKRVILIYPIPEFLVTAPDATGLLQSRGDDPRLYRIPLTDFESQNAAATAKLDELVARGRLAAVYPRAVFCAGKFCSAYDGRDVLYFDGVHLSMHGARKLAAALKSKLELQTTR